MAKKKRELTTRRMSSGAQQYVREGAEMGPREMSSPTTRRMKTIDETIRALDRSTVRRDPTASRLLNDAFIDESRSADEDRANRRANRRKEGGAMKSKKTLAPAASKRPPPRPAGLAEQADLRKAMDSADAALRESKREAADREMGMKAGGKVKKMMNGGKCRGMGAATKGGNYSRG